MNLDINNFKSNEEYKKACLDEIERQCQSKDHYGQLYKTSAAEGDRLKSTNDLILKLSGHAKGKLKTVLYRFIKAQK